MVEHLPRVRLVLDLQAFALDRSQLPPRGVAVSNGLVVALCAP